MVLFMKYGILKKSYCYGALMDEDVLLYALYEYKGHLYRLEKGLRITSADKVDVEYIEELKKEFDLNEKG